MEHDVAAIGEHLRSDCLALRSIGKALCILYIHCDGLAEFLRRIIHTSLEAILELIDDVARHAADKTDLTGLCRLPAM